MAPARRLRWVQGRASRTGDVELGYAVAPGRQGRGIATAVVEELVSRARTAGVNIVSAHTLAEENVSTAVLRKEPGSPAPVNYASPTVTSGVGSGHSLRPSNTRDNPERPCPRPPAVRRSPSLRSRGSMAGVEAVGCRRWPLRQNVTAESERTQQDAAQRRSPAMKRIAPSWSASFCALADRLRPGGACAAPNAGSVGGARTAIVLDGCHSVWSRASRHPSQWCGTPALGECESGLARTWRRSEGVPCRLRSRRSRPRRDGHHDTRLPHPRGRE